MQTYELLVSGRSVRAASVDTTLVRTSIGIDQVHVLFDDAEWLDFPISATFAMGDVMRTAQLVVSRIDGSEWAAEATVTVPYEVVRRVGRIRVTFQGTDGDGRHIITAKGSPLSVVEAGDVEEGEVPGEAPTVDEWQHMRDEAQRAINEAQSLVNNLQAQLDSIVAGAEGSLDGTIEEATAAIEALVESARPIATEESLGMVRVGEGLSVTTDGLLSSAGLTQAQRRALENLILLAGRVTDADVTTTVQDSPRIEPGALPVATPVTLGTVMPDGTTIRIGEDGMIHAHSAQVDVATVEAVGVVKPDGSTITIDDDGTIHGSGQGGGTDIGDLPFRVGYVGNSSYMSSVAYVIGDESDGWYRFPDVYSIPQSAYMGCSSLVSAEFATCRHVGSHAFEWCTYLTNVDLPQCYDVGQSAFAYCRKIKSADFPTCMSVGSSAFYSCSSLSRVSMPHCGTVGESAFAHCQSLTSAYLPTCTNVSNYAFAYAPLVSIDLPECLSLPYKAFLSCTRLETVVLSRCMSIESSAFANCVRLTRLDLTGVSDVPYLPYATAFANTPISSTTSYVGGYGSIYVPSSLYSRFRSAYVWKLYSSRIVSA